MTDRWRKTVILVKRETTEGTDPVPTGGGNAILATEPQITPLANTKIDRKLLYPQFGASPDIFAAQHVELSFAVEIAGAGAAGTVPGYGALLRGCGCSETVNGGVSVVYAPVSTGEDSVACYFHKDGTRHIFLGGRGNCVLNFEAEDVAHFMFTFQGLLGAISAQALPTVDFSAFKDPLPVGKVNTPTHTLDGFAAVTKSYRLDMGNKITHRDMVNSERIHRSDRQSSGSVVIEAPPLGTKNFFTIANTPTLVVSQLIHGVGAGKIVQLDGPKVQLSDPAYSDDEDIVMLGMNTKFTRNAGDDEWLITVK